MSTSEIVVTVKSRKLTPPVTTMELRVAGMKFDAFTGADVQRDISEISGHFAFDYLDAARIKAGLPSAVDALMPIYKAVKAGQRVEIALRDVTGASRTVMIGHVEDLRLEMSGGSVSCRMEGRDLSGDLVDCDPLPQGPFEFNNLDLLAIAQKLCAPFGLKARADVALGDPFRMVAIQPGEPGMGVLEKLGRARGVLITSDGIGGLVLTGPGTARGAGPLTLPGNVHALESVTSWRERFSDYWELGQAVALTRPQATPTLSPANVPAEFAIAPVGQRRAVEARATAQYGHAIDPAIGRPRPKVWVARSTAGSSRAAQLAPPPAALDVNVPEEFRIAAGNHPGRRRGAKKRKAMKPRTDASPWTLQDQAKWRMRTMRARADQKIYVVQGWDVGGVIWTPNTLVAVTDGFSDLVGDRLIAGIGYTWGPEGPRTRLRLVEPDAFDLTGDDDQGENIPHRRSRRVGTVDGTRGGL